MPTTTLETLEIQFKAGMAGVNAQLSTLKSKLSGIEGGVASTQNRFAGLGSTIKTVLGAVVVRQLAKVGSASLSMANDAVESENLFAVSMKSMAGEARSWSEDLQDSLGLNAVELRKNVGVFNTMFMSMGLGKQAAYDMSTGLAGLANDMASFYNLSPEEAFDKLRAGITGETEPLKRLGILVDENTTKTYAYANGIAKQGKELTQTEKLQARYAAILAQTANAQGDLARTIDSPVNQIRVLNSMLDQAKLALGQAFQPIQAIALPLLKDLAGGLKFVAQAFGAFMKQLTGYSGMNALAALSANKSSKAQDGLADSLDQTAKSLKKSGGAAKQAAKDGKVGLKAFDEINKLADETTNAGGGGKLDEIEVPETTDAEGYAGVLEAISLKVQAAADAIRRFWDGLQNSVAADVVRGAGDAIGWLWENGIRPLGEWIAAHPTTVADGLLAIGSAIVVWNVGLNYETWLTGIATGLKAIGGAIAAHPVLFSLAVLAGGLVLVGSAIKQANEEAKAEDLAKRFGDLALSMEELKSIADTITTPFATAAQGLVSDFNKIRQSVSDLKATITANNKLVYAYSITAQPLTENQKAGLIASVQAQVDKGMSTLEGAQVTASMALEALFKGSGVDGSEIVALNKENWEKVKKEAAGLGADLQKAVSDALTDGTITEEEQKGIQVLQSKYAQMIAQATDPDMILAQAQIRRLGLDFSQAELTPDTIKSFNDVLNTRKQELLSGVTDSGQLAIDYAVGIAIQANPNISDAELAKVKNTAEAAFTSQKLQAEMEVEKVRINGVQGQLKKAYGDALKQAKPAVDILSKNWIKEAQNVLLNEGWSQESIDTGAGQIALALKAGGMLRAAMEGVKLPEEAAQKNIREFLTMLEPNVADWERMAAEYRAQGKKVPDELQKGINDYYALQAVSMSTSDLANLVTDQIQGLPNKFADIGTDAVNLFSLNLSSGGGGAFNSASSLKAESEKGLAGIVSAFGSYGTNAANAYANSLSSSGSRKAVVVAAETLANDSKNRFKNVLGIKSPSKVFRGFGDFSVQGLILGINDRLPGAVSASEKLAEAVFDPMAAINTELLKPGAYSITTSATQALQVGYDDQSTVLAGAIQQATAAAVSQVLDKLQINVDGETFGKVSIRNINDAQRRAGQVLLDF